MAPSPWPDYQCSEPKAPDKKSDVYTSGSGDTANTIGEIEQSPAEKDSNDIENGPLKPQVTALDEFGLKALLDEAMTLRFSEDVEGKSTLLQELVEEVNSKKPSRAVTTDVPKQSSSSGKPNKKNKVRRSHGISDQNEISHYAKHKSDSKTSSKSILGPKNVDFNESNVSREIGKIVSDVNKKGKQSVYCSDDVQKQMGRIDEIMKSCDMAKIVTIPGGNRTSSESKNSKNMIRINPVSEISDKRPKDHYTPNIDKICRKIDQKEFDRVKALSQGPGVKEISVPTAQLNSIETNVLRKQVEMEKQLSIEDKKTAEFSDVSKNITCENDLGGCLLRDIIHREGDEQLLKIKKIDENGNALCSSKVDDSRKGKARRVKVKNDKNTVMSEHIEGYRGKNDEGNYDIEAVIQYIESTDDKQAKKNKQSALSIAVSKQGRLANKIRPIREKRDKSTEPIGRKGRKNNEKLKKSNSLEEVSTSTLEDLTSPCFSNTSIIKCLDNSDISQVPCKYDSKVKNYIKTESSPIASITVLESNTIKNMDIKKENKSENESASESDFHVVRKKHRKKKKTATCQDDHRNCKNSSLGRRFNEGGRRRGLLKNYGYLEQSRGRKPAASVPPSDKSGDSSDADSVHSLPVSSSSLTSKNAGDTKESSLTSYADIARSVTTPPRGGSTPILNKPTTSLANDLSKAHCVSSEEIPSVTLPMPLNRRQPLPSASLEINIDKDYPPLKKPEESKGSTFVEFTLQLPKNEKVKEDPVVTEETIVIKRPPENKCIVESTTFSMPIEDTLNKRPPVILLHEKSSQESSAVNELVFGFEVNQQLLVSNQNDSNQNDDVSTEDCVSPIDKSNDVLEEDSVKTDYDNNHSKSFNHYSIVQYISREWNLTYDELKNGKKGNVIYFKP